jgi:serine/threonine-protein kinase
MAGPREDDTIATPPAAALGLEWDEDDMRTATERFEGVQPLSPTPDPDALPNDDEVTRQVYVGETFSGVAVGFSGVRPTTAALTTPASTPPARPQSVPPPARPFAITSEERDAVFTPPQTHYGAVVGIVAAIIAIIAGALYLSRGSRAAEIHMATAPADAEVLVDGRRAPGDQSPFVIHDLEPHKPHELEVRKAGYRTWSTRLVLESGQTLQLPIVTLSPEMMPPATTAAEPHVEPIKEVSVNQLAPEQAAPAAEPEPAAEPTPAPRVAKSTPAPAPRRPKAPAAPKPSAPRPRAPAVASKPVAAPAGAAAAGSGVLRINSRPWAEVSIDGRPVGNTPLMNLTLSAGAHRVRLKNPQFGLEKTIKVQIVAGDVLTKVVDLQ